MSSLIIAGSGYQLFMYLNPPVYTWCSFGIKSFFFKLPSGSSKLPSGSSKLPSGYPFDTLPDFFFSLSPAMSTPFITETPKARKLPFTRYFTFSRTSPRNGDLDFLINTCINIHAYLAYFVGVDRITGYFILCGPRAYVDDMSRVFPNFLVSHLDPRMYFDMLDFTGFTFVGTPPFESIRKTLFPAERKRLFDGDEEGMVAATKKNKN